MSKRHNILVACMPKSGSTYLTTVLSRLPGFGITSWVPDYGRREQELCRQKLEADRSAYPNHSLVAQHHVRYSDTTKRYIEEFDLKPLVLVRNLYDVVPSLIDHHRTESVVYPMAYVPRDIVEWDWERAAEFVTYMALPWYFNFFASWHDCDEKILLTYEELIVRPRQVIGRICSEWGVTASDREIDSALEQAGALQTRRNIGVAGRGRMLPEKCRGHIHEMASYYKGLDLSQVALEAEAAGGHDRWS